MRRRGRASPPRRVRLVVALLLCVLWAGLIGLRWAHFVGVDPATGKVAVYQGVPSSSAAASSSTSSSTAAASPRPRCRRRAAGSCSTTPCARASRRVPVVAQLERDRAVSAARPALEPQPRARLAAARRRRRGRRLHVRARRALGRRLDALAHLRGRLPRALRRRARGAAHRAAERRPGAAARGGLLVAVGLVEIHRIDPELARDQALWLAVGVGCFVALLGLRRLPRARALPLPARRGLAGRCWR